MSFPAPLKWSLVVGLLLAASSRAHAQSDGSEVEDTVPVRFQASLDVGELKVWVRPVDGEYEPCFTPCELRLDPQTRYELAASLPGSRRRPRGGTFVAGAAPGFSLYYEDASATRTLGTYLMNIGYIAGALGGAAGLGVGMLLGNSTVQVASVVSGAILLILGVIGSLMRGAPDALRIFAVSANPEAPAAGRTPTKAR